MKALLGLIASIFLTLSANAASISYGVNIQETGFSIVGTITTDGTLGALTNFNIIAYNLAVTGTTDVVCLSACTVNLDGTVIPPPNIGGGLFNTGPDLFATPQSLSFNFGATNSNFIVLGADTYPNYFVEFFDHQLVGASGTPNDEGPGGIGVGGLRFVFYPNLGNLGSVDGSSFTIGAAPGNETGFDTPLPAAFPLFATGLGALGLLGWRRKKRANASVATAHPRWG
jgi:hypothetical protein